jgi:hypothetical protein
MLICDFNITWQKNPYMYQRHITEFRRIKQLHISKVLHFVYVTHPLSQHQNDKVL